MTDAAAVFTRLCALLREHDLYLGDVRPSSALQADLGLDSLQLLTFVVEAENAFGINLSEEAETELVTLGDVADYVVGALAQKDAAGAAPP